MSQCTSDETANRKACRRACSIEEGWAGHRVPRRALLRERRVLSGAVTFSGAPWTFTQGRMTVTATDGSRLDAGTGDPNTYKVTVTSGGRSTSVVKPIETPMQRFRMASYCG